LSLYGLFLEALPKRLLTVTVGSLARSQASRLVIPWYAKTYGINAAEAELPLHQYPSLAAFFSRRLRLGLRPVAAQGVVSPVDGMVQRLGQIAGDELLQAKGWVYSVSDLLGSSVDAGRFVGGQYVTLYLSPSDYHRVHMPVDGRLTKWRYIPGRLFPVNSGGLHHIPGLFTKNERLVTFIQTDSGEVAVVKVGATIVGSIHTPYTPQRYGAWSASRRLLQEGEAGQVLAKGAEMGFFELGSTVILLFNSEFPVRFDLRPGQKVYMGQQLGSVFSDPTADGKELDPEL